MNSGEITVTLVHLWALYPRRRQSEGIPPVPFLPQKKCSTGAGGGVMHIVCIFWPNLEKTLKYFLHCLAGVRKVNEDLGRAEFSVEVLNNAGRAGLCCLLLQGGWPWGKGGRGRNSRAGEGLCLPLSCHSENAQFGPLLQSWKQVNVFKKAFSLALKEYF